MRSDVAFIRLKEQSREGVFEAVSRAMDHIAFKDRHNNGSLFIKLNLLSKELVPGQCTSPWVFEAVLKKIRESYPDLSIFFGDADVATECQAMKAAENWGHINIGKQYNTEFVNLSKEKTKPLFLGPILKEIDIPEILTKVDQIITLPVAKTHCITPFTGCLKNQWGLLPRIRFKYHPVVHQAIAEINAFFKSKMAYAVADLTIAMEGPGPRVGFPKICNVVMASKDLVALDASIARYMGIDPREVGFLKASASMGLGALDGNICGDDFSINVFKPGVGKHYFVYRWRDRLEKIPGIRKMIYWEKIFRTLGFFASKYQRWMWYRRYGRRYLEEICRETGYGEEFSANIR